MKKIIGALVASGIVMLLQGCIEELQLMAKAIKNVEKIEIREQGEIDVYCPTGICQFELQANQQTIVTVNMHYDISRRFSKIEGVSVAGKRSASVQLSGENTFSFELAGNSEPSKVQVVDYYRN